MPGLLQDYSTSNDALFPEQLDELLGKALPLEEFEFDVPSRDNPFNSDMQDPRSPRTPSPKPGKVDDDVKASPPPWKDTPIARKRSGTEDAFLSNKADDLNDEHAREGKIVLLGPMPVRDFLHDFLPPAPHDKPMPRSAGAFDEVPQTPTIEREFYKPLLDAINDCNRCPSVKFCITADHAEDPGEGGLKPDVCGYDKSDLRLVKPQQKRELPKKKAKQKANNRKVAIGEKYIANLGLAEIVAEFKKEDPLSDCKDHPHESTGSAGKIIFFASEDHAYTTPTTEPTSATIERRNFGQSIKYPSAAFQRQHRVHYFSLMFIGTRVRFFRWDRAGGIVTESLDYRNDPELLCEFLWRFHFATPVQRGFDPSVTIATKEEETLFKTLIREHTALQLGVPETNAKELDDAVQFHYEKGKVTKVMVSESDGSRRFFLVSVPLKSPRSIAGRSTRSYWAVELFSPNEGRVVFLKDMWCPCKTTVTREGCVYAELHAKKVTNICDIEFHGDLLDVSPVVEKDEESNEGDSFRDDHLVGTPGRIRNTSVQRVVTSGPNGGSQEESKAAVQYTRTADYINAPWICELLRDGLETRIIKRIHCRLVLKQAGYPLKTFKSSRELFSLDSAFRLCNRVHRDISIDNIVLYREKVGSPRRGLLIDWEFSVVLNAARDVGDYYRSLTWAFIPARVLRYRDYGHQTHEDDMESLFYVIMYGSLRWLPHNEMHALGQWMHDFFDFHRKGENGRDEGGAEKCCLQMQRGKDFSEKFKFENKYIRAFFESAYSFLGEVDVKLDDGYHKTLWTSDNLRGLFNDVCTGLCETSGTENDRTEHSVSDYFVPPKKVHHGTHTALDWSKHHTNVARRRRSGKTQAGDGDFQQAHTGTKRRRVDCGDRPGASGEKSNLRRSERLRNKNK